MFTPQYTGIMSFDYCYDHAGPLTRSAMTNALVLSIIAGEDGIDDRQGPGVPLKGQTPEYHKILSKKEAAGVRGMKIGILTEGFEQVQLFGDDVALWGFNRNTKQRNG
jgi:amidase